MDCKEKNGVLETYIASLSDADRENYKDLIEECRVRDARIKRDCEDARSSLQVLGGLQVKMIGMLKDLEGASDRLLKNNAELYLNLLDKKKMNS